MDIVKKANKWECKVCRLKQVIQKEFFRGTGAECRAKVQHLNLKRGERKQAQEERNILEAQEPNIRDRTLIELEDQLQPPQRLEGSSKWADYVDDPISEIHLGSNKRVQPKELDEPQKNSLYRKKSDSNKRKAQNDSVVIKKSYSKWQDFL